MSLSDIFDKNPVKALLLKAFNAIDRDKSGYIDEAELREFISTVSLHLKKGRALVVRRSASAPPPALADVT